MGGSRHEQPSSSTCRTGNDSSGIMTGLGSRGEVHQVDICCLGLSVSWLAASRLFITGIAC